MVLLPVTLLLSGFFDSSQLVSFALQSSLLQFLSVMLACPEGVVPWLGAAAAPLFTAPPDRVACPDGPLRPDAGGDAAGGAA
jgi:hypothetical protein